MLKNCAWCSEKLQMNEGRRNFTLKTIKMIHRSSEWMKDLEFSTENNEIKILQVL